MTHQGFVLKIGVCVFVYAVEVTVGASGRYALHLERGDLTAAPLNALHNARGDALVWHPYVKHNSLKQVPDTAKPVPRAPAIHCAPDHLPEDAVAPRATNSSGPQGFIPCPQWENGGVEGAR